MELTPCQVLFTPPDIILTGDTHTSTLVDGLSSTAELEVGMSVTGAGIPALATIAAIPSATSITLSAAATATATGVALTFSAGQVDIGGTLGNVKVKVKYDKSFIMADQFGKTNLDARVSGFECTVETEIAEVKDKSKIKYIFPHASKVGQATKAIQFNTAIGDGDQANAGELVLHPLSIDPAIKNFDWTAFKACATAESEYQFSPTEQTKCKIVWRVYIDTSVTPARFIRYGDPALT